VAAEFDPSLWVLDGGACEVGIESAIVDCSRDRAVLLRPGTLTRERIEAALGGDLGYSYGRTGNLDALTVPVLQQTLGAANFGAEAQQLQAFSGLQEGLVKLA